MTLSELMKMIKDMTSLVYAQNRAVIIFSDSKCYHVFMNRKQYNELEKLYRKTIRKNTINKGYMKLVLDEATKQIIIEMYNNWATRLEISEVLRVSISRVDRYLKKMKSEGILKNR